MRVLQVVRPAVGGMKGHVLRLACGLRAFGFDSEIACPGDSELVHDALESKIIVHPVPIVGALHPLRDPLAIIALREVIKERRPALVHAHGSKAGLIARLAVGTARPGRPRVVVTVHNQVLHGGMSSVMRRIYITLERWLSRRTARVVTVSDALRDELLDVYGLPARLVTTVHDGLDLAPFVKGGDRRGARAALGIPDDALAFGLATRFAPQKGQDVLLEAAVPILEGYPRTWLVLAGDGPLLEVARTKARATRVRDRILFPGYASDIVGLLTALDLYVSPSIAEGLGLATIEASASALPVVGTKVGGTPEVVEDGVTGVLVRPGKAAPLRQAIERLLKDAALRRTMGDAGRERAVSEFGEARMLERIADVYQEVLA